MNNVWGVASGKGGTGKTTLVANLGAALALEGHKVLLVDLNVGLRCLDLCLGLDDRVLFDVMDVLEGACRPEEAILLHPVVPSLFLLPAAQNRSALDFDGRRLQSLCDKLAGDFDIIFLDCPPGLDLITAQASMSAGRGMIVTTADPAAIRDADRMAALFSASGKTDPYLVINRFRSDFVQKQLVSGEHEIANSMGLPLLGTVGEDDAIAIATLCGVPVVIRQPESPAARTFMTMARRMPGKDFYST